MADPAFDLSVPRRVHVVGIGGAGMSAIASVLREMGHTVSGSDLKDSPRLEKLRAAGITVHVGHDAANVGDVEAVAVSTAIAARNPEVAAARERAIPVLRRAEILGAIAATRRTVAVSGTHGKTTTSSMLALVLVEAGMRPSFIVGGDVNEIGTGAVWDDGDWFVVEADESDGTFLELGAEAVLVTSVEADHLDHFGTLDAVEDAFARFLADATGARIVCADDPAALRLGGEAGAASYGTNAAADYRMADVALSGSGTTFTLVHRGEPLGELHVPVPGLHNAQNAAGAVAIALELGAPFEAGRAALARYAGVARRFQFRGEVAGVTFVDDYAHNPGKLKAVLAATRHGDWRRVVCVFQPHRYSRTADLWRELGESLGDADLIVVTDVFAAGEDPRPGVTGKLVVNAALDAHPGKHVAWLPRRGDVIAYLAERLRPGDLCLTVGAGDITAWPDDIQAALAARRPA